MRCPYCGSLETQVKDFAADRGFVLDPPPPHLPRLRRPFHHLRARAIARTGRWSRSRAGARRSIATNCSARSRSPCASARSPPTGSSAWSTASCASSRARATADISTDRIGELVMEGLKGLDDVAYVRFASVYRNFREARDFNAIVGELEAEPEEPAEADRQTQESRSRSRDERRGATREPARRSRRGRALHGRGAGVRAAQSRPLRAQPFGRRADRPRWIARRARRDVTGRAPACRAQRASTRPACGGRARRSM